jgi:hypothetical protein
MSPGAWAVLLAAALVVYIYERDNSASASGSDGGSDAPTVSDILNALAKQEGVNPSHNNPGAICGSYTNGVCNGPKTFPTLAEGEAAAEALIQKILNSNPGISLRDFVTYWTKGPGAIGSTPTAADTNYVNGVSSSLGMSPDDPISGSSNDFVDPSIYDTGENAGDGSTGDYLQGYDVSGED